MTRAVLFDWRGTLACTLDERHWVAAALDRLGRPPDEVRGAELAAALGNTWGELDGPGVDSDPALHRRTYREVFARLGIDDELADALYAVESDPMANPFADDVAGVLGRVRAAGLRIAVVSDVHVDIRPAFAAAGLDALVDVFTLSCEHGMQKPDPRMFTRTLDALEVAPGEALMVGDRAHPDGGAVAVGIPTLLLPSLEGPHDCRLDRVLALCGLAA